MTRKEYMQRYYQENKERLREGFKANREIYLQNPVNHQKFKVRILLNNAVRRGKLYKLSCEICGDLNSEAHHDDYSKPLEVRWLCNTHHHELHKNENST